MNIIKVELSVLSKFEKKNSEKISSIILEAGKKLSKIFGINTAAVFGINKGLRYDITIDTYELSLTL